MGFFDLIFLGSVLGLPFTITASEDPVDLLA
jgi:hypothetical protein